MRYVIRDFSTIDGTGFAVVHVDEANLTGHASTCEVLRRYTAPAEAYQLDDGSGLTASEHGYRETSVEAAEAAHRRRFEVDFPMRRHDCVVRHQERLAGMMTLPELADELGLDATDMDDLSDRFEDANPDHPLFTKHQRDGQWLLEPRVADHLRKHVADHPDEYHRRPVPTIDVPPQVTWTPKTWAQTTPAPYVPVLEGLTFQQYESKMQVSYLGERLGHVNELDRGVVVDPYSHRYAVITAGFGECPRMWVCDGAAVTMTTHPSLYSFDLYRIANHTLTSLAFQEGHRAGTLDEYWARDDRARRGSDDRATGATTNGTSPIDRHYPKETATTMASIEGGIEGVISKLGETTGTLEQFRAYLISLRERLEAAEWSGTPLERLEAAAAGISGVQEHITTAADSIRTGGFAVRDTYTAHNQVGEKESVVDGGGAGSAGGTTVGTPGVAINAETVGKVTVYDKPVTVHGDFNIG